MNGVQSNDSKSFWWLQSVIAIAVLCFGGWAWSSVNLRPPMPTLNNIPRTIRPNFDMPLVVSDEQLQTVLYKLRPRFDGPPKTNFVDHALRMWGIEATFDGDDEAMSGVEMRNALLDQTEFAKNWGKHEPSLLQPSEHGIAVRTQEGRSSVSHVDHLLGSLSETGTPLEHPITLSTRQGTVTDLARHSFASFRLNQKEYEWTALTWALYARDDGDWFTHENQKVTLASMANRMMRQPLPDGVCYGQHRLYSLAIMLRVDSQMKAEGEQLFEPETRESVEAWLGNMTARLYRNQSTEGYWDGNWPDTKKSVPDPTTDPLSRRILATGHALEWWAMAPEHLHPPRETIVRAGQWLSQTISGMDDRLIQKNYTFLSHAGRALALWRAKFPHEVELGMNSSADPAIGLELELESDAEESMPVLELQDSAQ